MIAHLVLYTLSAFGFWYIVGASVISYPARAALRRLARSTDLLTTLLELLQCPACLGFWIGFVAAFTRYSPAPGVDCFMLGLYTSATNLVIAHLTDLMPEHE